MEKQKNFRLSEGNLVVCLSKCAVCRNAIPKTAAVCYHTENEQGHPETDICLQNNEKVTKKIQNLHFLWKNVK